MSSTSKKHNSFVSEPIRNKPAGSLAGIGPIIESRFEEQGYGLVRDIVGC